MSQKELDRLSVIKQVEAQTLSQVSAAVLLGISSRQVRNLQTKYRRYGAAGLISKHRGKKSNNRISDVDRQIIADTIRDKYVGFKPTLAHEKLVLNHDCRYSRESIRAIMIEHDLWKRRGRKQRAIQQMRARRPCFGELVQIDGSHHDWFEGRGPKCCLIVFIDDATSGLVSLWFVDEECTQGYFEAMNYHLQNYGRPVAYYSDKHSIFRVNIPEAESGTGLTQFGRACQELGIESICANTPQAKGRVERANQTLQDRLIKEMRLEGINDKDAANAWAPEFIKQYNAKFAVEPQSRVDAHNKSVPSQDEIKLILSHKHSRKVSKQLEVSYNNEIYQIQVKSPSYAMRKASVTVCNYKGEVTILYKGKTLEYKKFKKQNSPSKIISSKSINNVIDKRVYGHKPKKDHPWRKGYKVA
tara:strand:- start:300 stop:1544 length:1245 start_codon:yes stop_codon:yes gene_type:complete